MPTYTVANTIARRMVDFFAAAAQAADVVITRPGPRIVDGLEALARAVHPERFP